MAAADLPPEVHHEGALLSTAPFLTFASPAAERAFLRFRGDSRVMNSVIIFLMFGLSVWRLLTPGRPALLYGVWGITAGVSTASFCAMVAFAHCAVQSAPAERMKVAERIERITVVVFTTAGALWIAAEPLDTVSRCIADGHGDDSRCFLHSSQIVWVQPAIAALLFRPRHRVSVAIGAVAVACLLGGAAAVAAMIPSFSVFDICLLALQCVASVVCIGLVTYGLEQAERRRFGAHVALSSAAAEADALIAASRAVVRAALPLALLDDNGALLAASHRATAASVAVVDIFDYSQWSCGLLVDEVVRSLHGLLVLCDVVADEVGLACAMTYGDSCVVCGGLIVASPTHEADVMTFAVATVQGASTVDATLPIRAAACTGPLVGSVAGAESLRYVVAGAALEAARAALLGTASGTVTRAELPDFSHATSTPAMAHYDAPELPAVVAATLGAHDTALSAYSLRFTDEVTDELRATFVAEQERDVGRFTAVLPAVVFGLALLVLALEQAADDERRHHAELLPVIGVAIGFVLSMVVLLLRAAGVVLPYHALYATTAGAIFIGNFSLAFTGCVLASPHRGVVYVLGVSGLLPQLRWQMQVLLQMSWTLPAFLLWRLRDAYEDDTADVLATWFVLPLFAMLYVFNRAQCRQFATALAAQLQLEATAAHAAVRQALLAGVLPPHAVGAARAPTLGLAAPTTYMLRKWHGLTVLQLQLSADSHSVLLGAWRSLGATINTASDGYLELAQSMGDRLMIVGPLNDSPDTADVRCHKAARYGVTLLRRLAGLRHSGVSFTGIATAGSGTGALLGVSSLTYRLVGPAVRENDALLAAAPAAPFPVAFVSSSFRQQHCNFEMPHAHSGVPIEMSTAVVQKSHSAAWCPAPANDAELDDKTPFLPPVLWRARGVGVASMALIAGL
jgi:hypothetical protein